MIHRIKRHHHKIFASALTVAVIVSLIFGGTFAPQSAQAATYTFIQTNWAGGATATTATHPGNQTNWTNSLYSTGLTNDLAGWWKFDEGSGTSAADSSGNGNTGTLTNGPTWTAGKMEQALNFNAGSDYVNVGDPASGVLDFGTGDFTISLWLDLDGFVSQGSSLNVVLGKRTLDTWESAGYAILIPGDNIPSFQIGNGVSAVSVSFGSAVAGAGWKHLVVVRTGGSNLITYLDAVQKNTGTLSGSVSNSNGLTLGDDISSFRNLDGRIDDIRIYNRALTSSEITSIYTQNEIQLINSGASLTLATSTASTTQTSDATTNSGFKLTGYSTGTPASTTVTGTGNSASVQIATAAVSIATTSISTSYGLGSAVAIGTDGLARIVTMDASLVRPYLIICSNTACSSTSVIKNLSSASANIVEKAASIALNSNNVPIVAFNDDDGSDDLHVISCDDASCTSATDTIVDSTGDVGNYPSIAIGSDGLARVSYLDSTNSDLKYVQCGNWACNSGNTLTTVDSSENRGAGTSLVLGSDGFARISYYDSTNAKMMLAKCGNDACTSVSTTTVADANSGQGADSSLAIGSDGYPRIIYFHSQLFNRGVDFAICSSSDCSGSVTIQRLTNNGGMGFAQVGIALNSSNAARLFYRFSGIDNKLYYVKCNDSNCASPSTTVLDTTNRQIGVAIENDLVRVAYGAEVAKFGYETPTYTPSGIFTSGAIDTGQTNAVWDSVSWNASTTASTTVT
ncbi:LamG domain-containing protein, partial [Candidatus Wolfebacteria bacterium]|nr:LamG domain-containing protein [Candidatus Wolfebacteria bacterium]